MIREATVEDIPALLEMGEAFAIEAGVVDVVGWDALTVEQLLHNLIDSPDGVLWIGDNGMIGGITYQHPYSGKRVFQEFFWRSHGFEGMRLLKAAENQARENGAEQSIMIGMDTMPDTSRLYGRLNYKPIERLYCKEL